MNLTSGEEIDNLNSILFPSLLCSGIHSSSSIIIFHDYQFKQMHFLDKENHWFGTIFLDEINLLTIEESKCNPIRVK